MGTENEPTTAADWSWFTNLPLNDRVLLLSRPGADLPDHLANRLLKEPGASWTAWSGQPMRAQLSDTAVSKLNEIRHLLDHWWRQLTDEQRAYLISHKDSGIDASYRRVVRSISHDPFEGRENPDLAVLMAGIEQDDPYRLPPVIRTYVEMINAED